MSGAGAKPHRAHRKRGGGHEEEPENHERWLVTYADLLTLLMVLFIVMFAISAVDQKKFAELKDGLAKGFGAPSVAFTASGPTVQDADNTESVFDIASGTGGTAQDAATKKAIKDAVSNADLAKQQAQQQAAKREVQNFTEIEKKISEELKKQGLQDSVRYSIDERGLVVTIITSSVVFAGDRADLLPIGQRILDGIGPAVAGLPNRIEVDGHTNQLPVQTVNYPSGWELSTARASTVVRYLAAHAKIGENRLSAAGFADTRPLYPPSDPRAATLNRRVEIVVLSTLSADERALLPSAAAGANAK
jgi:chemotaxis protein MotB